MTTISIIIPYFNRENTIERCLRSIGFETNRNVEIILVDDCSAEPLKDFDHAAITVIRLATNMGPIAARSHGASRARHEHVMFLDSDDELLAEWYEVFCAEVSKRPEFDVIGFPDEKYQHSASFAVAGVAEYWKWVQSVARASDYIITMKTVAYQKIAMPKVRISELWYIVQLFESGLTAHYSNRPLFRYHQDSGNQLSKQRLLSFKTSRYTRESLSYAVDVFKRNETEMWRSARGYRDAWFRRFLKESVLALSVGSLARLFWGRNAGR